VHPSVLRALALVAALTLASALLSPVPAGASTPDVSITSLSATALAAQARMATLLPARVRAAKALGSDYTGYVTDLQTGATIWQTGYMVPMRGASTTKLATAVTALRLLGTTTRFPTRVVRGASAREVVLVAGGDPLLTSGQLGRLAHATAVALLPTLAPVPTPVPTPTPAPTPSSGPTGATGATGATGPSVPTAPPGRSGPTLPAPPTSIVVSVRLDDTLYPAPTPATGWTADYVPWVVTPVRPLVRDFRHGSDTAKDAITYFTINLAAELKALTAGRTDVVLTARYNGRMAAAAGAPEVARFAGNSCGAALARMLLVSDNDIAEMMFRNNAIAAGRAGSWAGARVTAIAELHHLGVDVTGWRLYDGSGVSRTDRVTARGLVQILRYAQLPSHPELAPLKAMLPVAGVSGTLHSRFLSKPTRCARARVFAKTGTLFDAIALAGYALGPDQRLRAFAIIDRRVNPNYSATAVRQAVEVVPATVTGCY